MFIDTFIREFLELEQILQPLPSVFIALSPDTVLLTVNLEVSFVLSSNSLASSNEHKYFQTISKGFTLVAHLIPYRLFYFIRIENHTISRQ